MAEAPDQAVFDLLARARRGQARDREVADALGGLEALTVVPAPGDMMRFLQDMDRQWKETGQPVKVGDQPDPTYVGFTTGEGHFAPLVFTSQDAAREHAAAEGLIDPGDAIMLMTSPPAARLWEILEKRWAGMILDPGSDHELPCDQRKVAQLWGLMTTQSFAQLERLWLMVCQGKPITQSGSGGSGLQAFVYDSQGGADHGTRWMQQHAPGAQAQALAPLELFRGLLRLGVDEILIDVGAPWQRSLDRDELVRMVEMLGGDEAAGGPASGAPAAGTPEVDPALQPAGEVRRAAADAAAPRRALPPVPPPGRSDEASIARYDALEADASRKGSMAAWLDVAAHDLDLYVPVNPQPEGGCLWPMHFKHPTSEGQLIAHTVTSEAVLRAWLEEAPPEYKRWQHLSGMEAFRWILASPHRVHEVGIDFGFPGRANGIAFTAAVILSPLFPLWMQLRELGKLPGVPAAKLGGLPGARGLKPESLRTLVSSWRDLVALAGPGDGAPEPVAHAGGRWLPAFSGPEPFLAFGSAHPEFAARPAPAGKEPPFGRWLRQSLGCDGVVLDPGSPTPLALDHADLLGLDLYARTEGPPRGHHVIEALAALQAEGGVADALLGRLVAEWPSFELCFNDQRQGLVLPEPGMDCCPVFTSSEKAEAYVAAHVNLGLFKGAEGMKPLQVMHRFGNSAFHFVLSQYRDGMWIDPVAMGGGGLHLRGDALAAARDLVDERLEPRVPGIRVGA